VIIRTLIILCCGFAFANAEVVIHKIEQKLRNHAGMTFNSVEQYVCNQSSRNFSAFNIVKYLDHLDVDMSRANRYLAKEVRSILSNEKKYKCWPGAAAVLGVYGTLKDIPFLIELSKSSLGFIEKHGGWLTYEDKKYRSAEEDYRDILLMSMRIYSLRSASWLARYGTRKSPEVSAITKLLDSCSAPNYWVLPERTWRSPEDIDYHRKICIGYLSYIHTQPAKEILEYWTKQFGMKNRVSTQEKVRLKGVMSVLLPSNMIRPEFGVR